MLKEKAYDIRLPRLHVGQAEVLPNLKRFNVLACGRRWGKTKFGVHRIVEWPLKGYQAGWFAPTYKYLLEVWQEVKERLAPVVARKDEQQYRLELVSGGVIDFWTLDNPDAGRGRGYKHVVIDEAAKVQKLEEAWTNAIRPTLIDFAGSADLLSTPRGRNFFWRAYTWGQSADEAEWASFRAPTAGNPMIAEAEIEENRRHLPDRVFRQEILAEFIEDAGGVFRMVTEAVDVGRTANDRPVGSSSYTMGVDLARVEDFTVLVVFDQALRQVYFERFNQISWERQIEAIKTVAQRYKAWVTIDSTGLGDPIFERLRRLGVNVRPFTLSHSSKEGLIDSFAMQLEQGKVRLMDIPEQTNELLAYEYDLSPTGVVRMNAPEGMHDDCVISLAMGCWGRTQKRIIKAM